jgi:hypothetical protein
MSATHCLPPVSWSARAVDQCASHQTPTVDVVNVIIGQSVAMLRSTGPALTVYKIRIEVDEHPWFVAPPRWHDTAPWMERDRAPLIDNLPGPPLIPATLGVEGAHRSEANFQAINFGAEPAVDAVGRDFLQAEMGDWVRFYPLPPHAHGRWLAEATAVLDCLDETRSDWRGEMGKSTVFRYALRTDLIAGSGVSVFVLPQLPYSSWLCTQRFHDQYMAAGLSGLKFERLMRMPDL